MRAGLLYLLGATIAVVGTMCVWALVSWTKQGKLPDSDIGFWGEIPVYAAIELVPSIVFALAAKMSQIADNLPPIDSGLAGSIGLAAAGAVQVVLTVAGFLHLEREDGSVSGIWWVVAFFVLPIVLYRSLYLFF